MIPSINVDTGLFSAIMKPMRDAQGLSLNIEVQITPKTPLTVVTSVTKVVGNFSFRHLIMASQQGVLPQTGKLRLLITQSTMIDLFFITDIEKRVTITGSGFQFFESMDLEAEPTHWFMNSGKFSVWRDKIT